MSDVFSGDPNVGPPTGQFTPPPPPYPPQPQPPPGPVHQIPPAPAQPPYPPQPQRPPLEPPDQFGDQDIMGGLGPMLRRLIAPQLNQYRERYAMAQSMGVPQQPWHPPYTPARTRPRAEWGQDWLPVSSAMNYPGTELSPYLPPPDQANGMMVSIGQYIGRWGSNYVGTPARDMTSSAMTMAPILDMLSKGQFSKNFLAARMGNLKLAEEERAAATEETLDRMHRQLMAFSDIIGNFEAGGLDEDTARDQVRALALQVGHPNLINILDNVGLAAVQRFLDQEDQKFRDLYAAHASATKSSTTGPDPFTDTGAGGGSGTQREETRPKKPDITIGTPQLAQAGGGTPTPDTTKTRSMDDDLRKKYQLNDNGLNYAHAALNGDEDPSLQTYAKKGGTNVRSAAHEMDAAIQNIASNSALSRDQKMAQIRAIDSQQAELIDGLSKYETDPTTISVKGNYQARMTELARRVTGYNRAFWKASQQYRLPNTKEAMTVQRANMQETAILGVYDALRDIDPGETVPKRWLEQMYAGNWSGDPRFGKLYFAIRQAALEENAVEMGGGVPRVQLVNQIIREMPTYSSPATIRSQFQVGSRDTWAGIDSLKKEWKRQTGQDQLPILDPDVDKRMNAIMRINPITGQVPGDAPERVKVVDTGGRNPPKWATPDQLLPPLTLDQIRDANQILHDPKYRDSTDPEVQKKLQFLRQRIGISPGFLD